MTIPTQLADGVLTQPNGCGFISLLGFRFGSHLDISLCLLVIVHLVQKCVLCGQPVDNCLRTHCRWYVLDRSFIAGSILINIAIGTIQLPFRTDLICQPRYFLFLRLIRE